MRIISFFGGRTPEHDISIASAVNVLNGLDKKKHAVEAVYIAADGRWSQPVTIGEPLTGAEQLLRLCGRPVDMGTALRSLAGRTVVQSSDAHHLDDVGKVGTNFWLEAPTLHELRLALAGREGRYLTYDLGGTYDATSAEC